MTTTSNKKRLERIETQIRRLVEEFYQQFSKNDVDDLLNENPAAWARFNALGGFEIVKLQETILTPDERAELDRIEQELKDKNYRLRIGVQPPDANQSMQDESQKTE